MGLLDLISNVVRRLPIEKIIFPPRDKIKALEEFAATTRPPQTAKEAPPEESEPSTTLKPQSVATACVACALGHFSTSAGLLNEAVRFKAQGLTSNEVVDRIGKVLEEQNALERVDLTSEKIRALPPWERELAEEALQQSRSLRHRLETLDNFEALEQAAADTAGYYRNLNREWWKRRLAQSPEDTKILPVVSEKEKEEIRQRAHEKIEEVLGNDTR